jgi:hypothetical protein
MSGLARTRDRIVPPILIVSAIVCLGVGILWFAGSDRSSPVTEPSPVTATSGSLTSPSVSPGLSPSPAATGKGLATRVVIRSLGIDLPVISGATEIPDQGPAGYPPCDVALYLPEFVQPGQRGATYLYAHAREGMFLPLLLASEQRDGAGLIGMLVEVYTDDDRQYVYSISEVRRHALDFSLAQDIPRRSRRLVLQTSEGPRGTVPKLQVLAEPVTILDAEPGAAHPSPRPRACYNG